jgi:cytochrome P450
VPDDHFESNMLCRTCLCRTGRFPSLAKIIYAAASDTLANTLTWLCSLLSDHPEVQERMHAEIENCLKSEGEIKKEKCPFTRSVLLENMRLNPVADIIPHEASEDSLVDGVLIKKGSTLYGIYIYLFQNPILNSILVQLP